MQHAKYTPHDPETRRETSPMADPKTLCVYCGSRTGEGDDHETLAQEMGDFMAKEGVGLVFGGGGIGLMGVIARKIVARGGRVIGVIPEHLDRVEIGFRGGTELHVVKSMHERKKLMFDLCDAIVVLPGGLGTLDELFEIITWSQLELHDKPVIIVNHAGYWDPLITLIDHVIDQGFAAPECRDLFTVVSSAAEVIPTIRAHKPPVRPSDSEIF